MNKNKYKIILLLLSIVTITLGIGLTTSLKNMQKYNDKYNTVSLLENKEVLNLEQMEELTRKTLIICSTEFDASSSGAISVDKSGNIYTLTYNSSKEAQKAYEKYSNDEDIIFCQLDETLGTATLTPEEMEEWGIECDDCEKGDCDIHSIITKTETLTMEDFDWITNGIDTVIRVDGGYWVAGPTYNGHIAENVMQNLESNSSEDSDRKAIIVVFDSGAPSYYTNGYNAITGTNDVSDTNGHGTFVINTIEKNLGGLKNYEIIPIKIANDNGIASVSALVKGLEYIQNINPTVVNISLNSLNNTKDEIIEGYLGKLYENQVITCVSAGNNGDDACNYSPSKFATAIVVGSCDKDGNRKEFSNYGESVDYNVVSNSTSEAAAITSALYAKAYINYEYFFDIINNSNMYFTQKGNLVSNIWNTGENSTDEAEYSTWYAGAGTKTLGTIPADSSPRKVKSISAYFASGVTKGNGVENIACKVSGCSSDKHYEYLGVWGTGPRYWYGSGAQFTATINLNGSAIGSVTVTHKANRTDCGGPCDGDSTPDEYGSVGGEDTHKLMTVTCNSNTLAANTEGKITVSMPGTGGTWVSPGILASIRDTWTYEVESLHTCSYTQQVVNSTYLRTSQTCTQAETYYKSCTCGKYTTSAYFTNKAAAGHNYSSPYTYSTNNGVDKGVRYVYCNRTWNGTVCNTYLSSDFRQIVYVQYQNADGTYAAAKTLVDNYYKVSSTVSWSYSTEAAYNKNGLATSYTVGTAAKSQTIKVPRNSYNQTVYVRYQNADGTWGNYSAVINKAYYYGATVSWSRAADATYQAASISYTVTGANTKYVDVKRQTYSQVVKIRYENADGTYTSYSNVINGSYRYGQTVSWSRAADNAYKSASVSYTVKAAKTTEITIYRQTYTFDINGFLEGTLAGSLAGTFGNNTIIFGSFDVSVNGVSSENNAGDYYKSLRYGSKVVVSDIKALSGYKYNGVYSCSGSSKTSSPLSFTITENSSLTLKFDDETKPVITFTSSHSDWTNSNVTLTFKATDASTVVKMELLREDVVVKTVNSGAQSTYTISTDENIEYTVRATDLFGNVQTKSLTVKRDTVKPTITLDKYVGNWASSHTVNITVSDDASGIIDSGYYFSLESTLNPSYTSEGTKLTYSATQNKDGVWTLYYMAKDKAGNIVKGSTSAYCVDNTLPTIDNYNIEYKGDHVVVNVEAQDNLSKINGWNYNKTGTTPTTWVKSDLIASDNKVNWSFELDEAGTYYIFVKDTKGNVSKHAKIVLTTYTIDYINNYGGNTSVYKTLDKIFVGSEWITESAPINTTYIFKSWNTDNLGTGVNVNANTKYQFTEQFITSTLKQSMEPGTNNKLSLYGWWEKGYSLTFDLNGGIQNKSSENIVLNGKFYNNVTSYTFDIVGGLTAEKLNYYDKQVGTFNSYGTIGVNGANKDIVRKSIDGTTYRLLGWSLDKNAKVPDNNLIVYNNNHDTTYTISSNTILYAVWEPVLYVQVAGYRNLGTIEDPDVTNVLKVATQGSTLVSGQTYNGFITTLARPGEAIKYNLQFRGELDRIQITVDPYISNMYDLQNPIYNDILNKIDISSMEEVIPSEGYDKAYSSLNRIIKNPAKSITRQFYLPQYLGSQLAYEASKQQTQYYVDYKFINTDSFYYKYLFGTDEIVTVRQYIILAKSSSGNGEIDSVLNDLRTKLKIRFR